MAYFFKKKLVYGLVRSDLENIFLNLVKDDSLPTLPKSPNFTLYFVVIPDGIVNLCRNEAVSGFGSYYIFTGQVSTNLIMQSI